MESKVTFVTSYLVIYGGDEYDQKTFEKRFQHFMEIVKTGINICIFSCPEFELFQEMASYYKNVRAMELLDMDDLLFWQMAQAHSLTLPDDRNHGKDTANYMLLMHSKLEFMKKAIDANPFHSEVFCWFDFSLPHVFKHVESSLLTMKNHSTREYVPQFLAMPGCWDSPVGDANFLKSHICWRFCGGFFIGDKASLLSFYEVSVAQFPAFLAAMDHTIVWEVNYWAWLESNRHIQPIWYPADHNDTIVEIPVYLYAKHLINDACQVVTYSYPALEQPRSDRFFPSSASYLYDRNRGKHILNTRYVNYFYKDNWDCIFFNDKRQIRTVNVCSELNKYFEPIQYEEVLVEETNVVPNMDAFSLGLEDIRLYEADDKIMFIASNVHYIALGKSRMVVGEYDHQDNLCKDLRIVQMMWDSPCEKNWCPLPPCSLNSDRSYFIYQWSPYIVGYIVNNEANPIFQTCLEQRYENKQVNRFRGSTSFIAYDQEHWIGVVHYSEHTVPPTYYHCLVLVHMGTMLPVRFSDPFKFSVQPIEFCIGFTIEASERYLFWISQMDRDPKLLLVEKDKIPLTNRCY